MTIDHLHALPLGTHLEEFRLDAQLGAGGFGITYRAHDELLDKVVAIKEYLPRDFATRTAGNTVAPISDADARDYQWGLSRFLDEARTLARFDHPHLNKVHRFFEANGTAYMVLEYIHGETLASRLGREPRLSEDTLTRLLEEMLSGLAVIHEAGYVHRDIKPGNLMLRAEDGSAVLLDFGAARQAVGQRSKSITSILTPGYAPIEQYDSKADDVGPWSDIYALGMVAYKCISGAGDGELPDAVTRGRTQRKGGVDLASAVEAGRGRYDPRLLAAIDWAIEVDEEARPQGVSEWLEALAGGSAKKRITRPVRKPATRPAKPPTPERTGMSWSSLALTVVIVVLLGASAWQGWRLYRGIPMVGLDGTETTVESQAGMQAESETDSSVETAPQTADVEASADNTDPEESPSAEQDEVTRLLAAAELDITARRLTSPVGNNAWEKYQRVLSLSPAHPAALAGMERVMGSYLELFGTALEQEDFDKADNYLERIRDLHPDSPVLEEEERRLGAVKQARAERLAERERQRIEQAIKDHWDAFEAALEEEDLDGAEHQLAQVRDLNPDASVLEEREQRLEAVRSAQPPGLPPGISAGETCAEKPEGSDCWLELENQPGCYIWNIDLQVNETATWSATCAGGLAEGTGEITWVSGSDRGNRTTATGQLQQGKRHGQWVLRFANGTVEEGPMVANKKNGRWVVRFPSGRMGEGPFVDDKKHGQWVIRQRSGNVYNSTYVNGELQ